MISDTELEARIRDTLHAVAATTQVLEGSTVVSPSPARPRRPLLAVAVAFVVVVVAGGVIRLLTPSVETTPDLGSAFLVFDGIRDFPGIDQVIPLNGGGVKTMAVDGDTLWVMNALQYELKRFDATTGAEEDAFAIDGYVEGVTIGGGYVWLLSYDNGGELLRFDPVTGLVDLVIPLPAPVHARWFGDRLWASGEDGLVRQLAVDGTILSTIPGAIRGEGLGYLWIADPETGLLESVSEDGTVGEIVVPTDGVVVPAAQDLRLVASAGGYLWLIPSDLQSAGMARFDPSTGELTPLTITIGLHSLFEFDGSLWATSYRDHLMLRIDPATGSVVRYPVPGRPGGFIEADDALWLALYQPGALVRLDTEADLLTAPEPSVDRLVDSKRLICLDPDPAAVIAGAPTVVLDPYSWIDYASWSVVQAQLSDAGMRSCAFGYVDGARPPAERAADLADALESAGVHGPFLLVANGDGVHSTRLFAVGRDDIAAVVLVDPSPLGFQARIDALLGPEGHPGWADLDAAQAAAAGDFGDVPLVVIGQDPEAAFRNPGWPQDMAESAAQLDAFWQQGLAYYASLSTDTRSVVAQGTAFERVVWDRPGLIVEEVVAVAEQRD